MRPQRHSTADAVVSASRTFFVTTKTSMGRQLLQSDRNATLFIDVLRSYVAKKKFRVDDFVVMPDHVHLLLTLGENITVERAMQFIKGGFSYRLKKDSGYAGEVWQGGFSEVRVADQNSFEQHKRYIAENPVKAGLVNSAAEYPFCFTFLARAKQQGLKPGDNRAAGGTAEAVP
jgi:putative transposase